LNEDFGAARPIVFLLIIDGSAEPAEASGSLVRFWKPRQLGSRGERQLL
jgi:hypothetical protein